MSADTLAPSSVPSSRVRRLGSGPVREGATYVLYWMVAFRRSRHNFALQHAADRAEALGLPLVVLEPLRIDYPWACDRFHRFIIDGMSDNARDLADTRASYYPYVEPTQGAGKGMLAAFAKHAALVVSDDAPFFFIPKMQKAASSTVQVRFELVDSNGLYPIRATERVFTTAASFRRHLQKELPAHIADLPERAPLSRRSLPRLARMPKELTSRWPKTRLPFSNKQLSALAIDHSVATTGMRGGSKAARAALHLFVDEKLADYASLRNQPAQECESKLSPYLHFGHIAASEIFLALVDRENWTPAHLAERASGSRSGWWGMSAESEAFVDQLITWREIGLNAATWDPHYTEFEALPAWAQASLRQHASDPRPYLYSREELEAAKTHDPIWNAAQTQLVREGRIHNYLRMLWGKKILEWCPTPQDALQCMIELNNKYALDGRDPNSYSGILWTLGRYDRAWGPERSIFGKIRYMSSDNTARKLRLGPYLAKYAAA